MRPIIMKVLSSNENVGILNFYILSSRCHQNTQHKNCCKYKENLVGEKGLRVLILRQIKGTQKCGTIHNPINQIGKMDPLVSFKLYTLQTSIIFLSTWNIYRILKKKKNLSKFTKVEIAHGIFFTYNIVKPNKN